MTDEKYPTEGAEIWMLLENIFGNDIRFTSYTGNSNSLIEGFCLAYTASEQSRINTQMVLDAILSAMMDASDLEYYEIAKNIRLIHVKISSEIERSEKEGWCQRF